MSSLLKFVETLPKGAEVSEKGGERKSYPCWVVSLRNVLLRLRLEGKRKEYPFWVGLPRKRSIVFTFGLARFGTSGLIVGSKMALDLRSSLDTCCES